jgi:hypothetical protein
MNFFVNGMFDYKDNHYFMRFLCDHEIMKTHRLSLAIKNQKGDLIDDVVVIFKKETGAEIIEVKINDPQLETAQTYFKYSYILNVDDQILLTGSFPLIKEQHDQSLKLGFVSCNDNLIQVPSWNVYYEGGSSDLWTILKDQEPDVIIHMGDQIYADSVCDLFMKGHITEEKVYEYIRELYIKSYSEPQQSVAMRNSLNLMINDDHEFGNGYGTPNYEKVKKNASFGPYQKVVMKTLIEYQYQLFNEANCVHWQPDSLSYSLPFGKYLLLILDTRGSLYDHGIAYSQELCKFTIKELVETNKNNIVIILPRPLIHLDKYHANLQGCLVSDGVDESLHPINYESTHNFRQLLFDFLRSHPHKDIKIVSGDIHQTFIQDHSDIQRCDSPLIIELVTSGITRKPRAQEPLHYQMVFWIQRRTDSLWFEGVRHRRHHHMDNNFGMMVNDQLCNYHGSNFAKK